jgi:hypothetical protein
MDDIRQRLLLEAGIIGMIPQVCLYKSSYRRESLFYASEYFSRSITGGGMGPRSSRIIPLMIPPNPFARLPSPPSILLIRFLSLPFFANYPTGRHLTRALLPILFVCQKVHLHIVGEFHDPTTKARAGKV